METKQSFYGQDETQQVSTSVFREQGKSSPYQSFALELVPGHVCQLDCDGCYKKNGHEKTGGKMPIEDVRSYIDQALKIGFKEIVLIGGEPTLHSDIFDIIRYVREKGLTPILCTNGIVFRNPEKAKELEGTKTTVVTHAYIPGKEDVIDAHSGLQGYANMLKQAIENLRSIPGTTIVLETPLTDRMFEHAFEFFQYCRSEGFIPFIEISRRTDGRKDTTNVTPEDVASLFFQLQKFDQENFPNLADKVITPPAYGNKCTMSITGLHVKNYGGGDHGGVYSCCAQSIKHGDLKKTSLEEIMKSPTLSVFQNQDLYIVGPCKDCEAYSVCKGGCRGQAFLHFGCPRASSPTCHRISEEIRKDPKQMAPESCEGCPAENCGQCSLQK